MVAIALHSFRADVHPGKVRVNFVGVSLRTSSSVVEAAGWELLNGVKYRVSVVLTIKSTRRRHTDFLVMRLRFQYPIFEV